MNHDHDPLKKHRLVFEPPDLVISGATGVLTPEDAHVIWHFVDESLSQSEHGYWLSHLSALERYPGGDPGGQARKVLEKMSGIAFVGGNFQQRTIMQVLLRAARVLGATRKDMQMAFFADERAAREWLDHLRKKRTAGG